MNKRKFFNIVLLAFVATLMLACAGFFAACGNNETLGGGDSQEPTEYIVTFMADGKTVGTDTYTEEDKTIVEPAVPAKDGYTGKWGDYTLTSGNITVEAYYTLIEYTVTFKADGKEVSIDQYTIEDKTITEPVVPVKDGYTGEWEDYTLTTGNITVEAKYEPIEYTITFIAEGKEIDTVQYTVEDRNITEPVVPVKDDYNGVWENYTLTTGNITVEAVYMPVEYSIIFKADGKEVDTVKYTVEDKDIIEPAVPLKDGYTGEWEDYTVIRGNIIVNAEYTAIEYTVTFMDGDIVVSVDTYTVENNVIMEPAVPERIGYDGTWGNYILTTGDIIVNAVYTPIEYTISFVSEGKIVASIIYTIINQNITEPAVPDKIGYTGEWSDYTLTYGDIIVEAVYTPIKYMVEWKNYDGSLLECDLEVPYGTLPSYDGLEPFRAGDAQYQYTFSGWSPEISMVTGDIVYIAQFSQSLSIYTVTFKNYNGETLATDEVEYGSAAEYNGETPVRPKEDRKIYIFSGWDMVLTNITANITVYARYDIYFVYTFTFIKGDKQDINIIEGETIFNNMPDNTLTTVTDNIEKIYSWEQVDEYNFIEKETIRYFYFVEYVLNGGTNNKLNPSKVYNDTTYDLYEASKTGYDFIGWYTDSGYANQIIEITSASENLVLYAAYAPKVYSINYILNGGINANKNPSVYTVEDTIVLSNPSKQGYTFVGWYVDIDYNEEITSLQGYYGDLNLYAKFEPNKYIASFDVNGGAIQYTVNYKSSQFPEFDTVIQFYSDEAVDLYSYMPYKTYYKGYVFCGWCLSDNDSQVLSGTTTITEDFTVYAKWVKKSGSSLTSLTGYCSSVAGSNDESKFRDSDSTTFYVPEYMDGTAKITFYCNYTKYDNYGSISAGAFISYNGTRVQGYSTQSLRGQRVVYLTLEPGGVYTLGTSAYRGSTANSASASITIELLAEKKYIVNGSEIYNKEQIFDTSISYPQIKRDGYDFIGWKDNNNFYITANWSYAQNMGFSAVWALHNYSITYNLYGGNNSDSNPSVYTLMDTIVLATPTKAGYTFMGWYTDAEFKNSISEINGTALTDYNLYAKWLANEYEITFDYDGGENCPTVYFYDGENLIRKEELFIGKKLLYFVPEKIDYIFGGWYTDKDCTNLFEFDGEISQDIALYASWIKLEENYSALGSTVNVSIAGTTYQYIMIVSPVDQEIQIISQSNFDLYGVVCNYEKEILVESDDISSDNLNFALTLNMKAGTIYYIGYRANQAMIFGDAEILISGDIPHTSIFGKDLTIDSMEVTYDQPFSLPVPKKEGFEFIGWVDSEGNEYREGVWVFAEDKSLVSKWKEL